LGRQEWLKGVNRHPGQEHGWVLFCVFRDIMARIDWLGDMGTGFGKAVLGIALNFGVYFDAWMRWQG
jgi:hypothetical protein